MPINKRFIYVNTSEGQPKETDFELVTEEVPPLENGEVLCEAMYFSIDLCLGVLNKDITEGQTMTGTQVAKVVESADGQFPVGGLVFGDFGWQLYTVCRPDSAHSSLDRSSPELLSDLGHFPASLALGVLGTPGNVAYCGLLELCQPDEGEVVVVSSAGGAVGSIAAQIAKLKGCHVVGIVGSEEKARWLREVGLDAVINYRASDLGSALMQAAPHGVNCYFDNVGGQISAVVMSQMNMNGRVACCGATSLFNCGNNQLVPAIQSHIINRQLRVEGMTPQRWSNRKAESFRVLSKWLVEGKLQYQETVFKGFEELPHALISLLEGQNVGKVIVRA